MQNKLSNGLVYLLLTFVSLPILAVGFDHEYQCPAFIAIKPPLATTTLKPEIYNVYRTLYASLWVTLDDEHTITFADIIGGVPQEIQDLKNFIEDSEYYKNAGAIMPKGYLFYGPPGTGKTLLARALAGEVKAAFFATAGSELFGKYIGEGTERVQEIFRQAHHAIQFEGYKKAIIFIDELDSIGKRSSDDQGAAQECNRTINELLVQMDGFTQNDNIIVIGATNRIELIDDALKRAGRFEYHIEITLPATKKREALLKFYASERFHRETSSNVDFHTLAVQTEGFNCADIASLLNKAAIHVAREHQRIITMKALETVLEQMLKDKKDE